MRELVNPSLRTLGLLLGRDPRLLVGSPAGRARGRRHQHLGGADHGRPAAALPGRRRRARLVARRQPPRLPHAGGGRPALREGTRPARPADLRGAAGPTRPFSRSGRRTTASSISCRARCPTRWTSGASRPGGAPERLTFHNARVSHPTFRDRRTLLYLATAEDGSGPWIYAMDVRRREPRRISFGVETYTSLAASLDGSRLVATWRTRRVRSGASPFRRASDTTVPRRITLPTVSGRSPRFGSNSLLYVSSKGESDGIWKLANGAAIELWSTGRARRRRPGAVARRAEDRVLDRRAWAPAPARDGRGRHRRPGSRRIARPARHARLGAGRAIDRGGGEPRGRPAARAGPHRWRRRGPLVPEYAFDPTWSPDGRFLAYSGPDVGTTFVVKAVSGDGRPHPLPEPDPDAGGPAPRLRARPARAGRVAGRDRAQGLLARRSRDRVGAPADRPGPEFEVRDFDVSPDGREIVFDRVQENSDVVLIDLPPR